MSAPICGVCWSTSWAPCEPGTRDAIPDPGTGGWMVCQLCIAEAQIKRDADLMEAGNLLARNLTRERDMLIEKRNRYTGPAPATMDRLHAMNEALRQWNTATAAVCSDVTCLVPSHSFAHAIASRGSSQ